MKMNRWYLSLNFYVGIFYLWEALRKTKNRYYSIAVFWKQFPVHSELITNLILCIYDAQTEIIIV